jgi:predicted DNA-binding transcriptional regulator YafY
MARSAGRDQLKPMERLIRILICLADDHRGQGVPVSRLMRMADLTEDTEATRAQLRRDLTILRQGGWDIRNAAGEGEDGRYVLHVRDNRLALLLTPGERAALRSLFYLADIDHAKPPPFLGKLAHAVTDRSLLSFGYSGRVRVVHPDALYATRSGWVLAAREEADSQPKEYVTAWMDNVVIRGPGTAAPEIELPAVRLDPLLWPLDPPTLVRLGVVPDFVDDVLTLLPGSSVVESDPPGGEEVVIELTVTNQATFRAWLYSLGLRARVIEPPELVAEIVANLHEVISSGS